MTGLPLRSRPKTIGSERETPRQLATRFKEWATPAQYALVNLPEA